MDNNERNNHEHLSKEDYEHLYGKPEQVVQYMDYSSGDQDNSRHILNLVPSMLQPLEEISDAETDEFLSSIDIEALVKQAEDSTGGIPPPPDKDLKHFGSVTSEEEFKQVTNHSFSAATKWKALWAGCIFDQWKCICNYKLKVDKTLDYPEITRTLINMEVDVICEVLCKFVLKIHKQNGDEYPRETLYEIVLSLQNYLQMNGCTVKLLDHASFAKLRNTVDNKMKQLSTAGIIRQKKQAQPISLQQEEQMWQSGILGDDTPEKLVNTLLYLIGVHFTPQACNKHKNLKVSAYSQLKIKVDPETNHCYLEYVENRSKNNQGGILSLHHKTKTAKAFERTWKILNVALCKSLRNTS